MFYSGGRVRILLIGLLLLSSLWISAEVSEGEKFTKKAWEAWETNDRQAVRENLEFALQVGKDDFRAYIGFTFLSLYENDMEAAVKYLTKAAKINENIYPYLYSFEGQGVFRDMENISRAYMELVKSLPKQCDSTGVYRCMKDMNMGIYYSSKKNMKKSKAAFAGINGIKDWMLIGPFDNISGSGFNTVFPPEENTDYTEKFIGKDAIPIFWFPNKSTDYVPWINLKMNFGFDEAVYYANSYVYSPQKQDVQLRLGTSGSFKLFLNDNMIISEEEETNNGNDSFIVNTKLEEGWNKLLLKIGQSEIESCNFLIRITDETGTPIKDLDYTSDTKSYTSKPISKSIINENFAEVFFKQKTEQYPNRLENYLLLANVYHIQDKTTEAEKILNKALELFPDVALIHYFHGINYKKAGKEDKADSAKRKLTDLDSTCIIALLEEYSESMKNEDFKTADELIIKIREEVKSNEIHILEIVHYAVRGMPEKMLKTLEKAYTENPNEIIYAKYMCFISQEVTKEYKESIQMIKKLINKNYTKDNLTYLADLYLKDGNIYKWKEYFDKAIELNTSATGFYSTVSKTYVELQKYSAAEVYLNKAIEIAPTHSSLYADLGQIYRLKNEKLKAVEAYKKALELNVLDYDSGEQIFELTDAESPREYFEKTSIKDIVKNSSSREDYPDDDAVILHNELKRVVFPNGRSFSVEEMVIKPFNQKGIDAFKEFTIGLNSNNQRYIIEESYVLKSDGTRVESENNKNTCIFKTLEENDIIVLRWKLKNYNSGMLLTHFWDAFYFNSVYPIKHVSYSVFIPAGREFTFKQRNMNTESTITEKPDGKIYTWQANDIPAIESEYQMPDFEDISKILYVSGIPDWEYLVNWYAKIANPKTKVTYEIEELVAELLDGKEDFSDTEKVRIIYNYITDNIAYSSVSFMQSAFFPQSAEDVLTDKIGDCKDVSALSISMLKAAGITAYFVLDNARYTATEEVPLPALNVFNHCITGVDINDKIYYLDHTNRNYSMHSVPTRLIDSMALLIKPGTTEPVFLDEDNFNLTYITRKLAVEIRKDDSVNIKNNSTKTGSNGSSFRSKYRFLSQTDKEKALREILVNSYGELELVSFETDDLEVLSNEVNYSYEYNILSYIKSAGNMKFAEIPWPDPIDSNRALSYEVRENPIFLWNPSDSLHHEIDIMFPADYLLQEVPENRHYKSFAGEYDLQFEYKNNVLNCKRILVPYETNISTERYSEFKEFYNNMKKADEMQLLLQEQR